VINRVYRAEACALQLDFTTRAMPNHRNVIDCSSGGVVSNATTNIAGDRVSHRCDGFFHRFFVFIAMIVSLVVNVLSDVV